MTASLRGSPARWRGFGFLAELDAFAGAASNAYAFTVGEGVLDGVERGSRVDLLYELEEVF